MRVNERGQDERPIGYWLKRADEAITEHVAQALGQLDLTRLQWQALNVIRASSQCTVLHLTNELRGFSDQSGLDALVNSFLARGWIARVSDSSGTPAFELTAAGSAGYAEALHIQTAVRQRMMVGLSPEEYLTVVRVLKAIVKNMQSGEPGESA